MQILEQERIKKDTIKLGEGLKKEVGGNFLSINPSTVKVKIKALELNQKIHFISPVVFVLGRKGLFIFQPIM